MLVYMTKINQAVVHINTWEQHSYQCTTSSWGAPEFTGIEAFDCNSF